MDLGLNEVYVLNLEDNVVKSFGKPGTGPGEFKDAAGVATDGAGNVLVADACNNRIQIFDPKRRFLGYVQVPKGVKLNRPSGILLDQESQKLYVLNLWSNSLIKFSLVK